MTLALLGSAAAFFGVLLIVVGYYQARSGERHSARRRLEKLERYSSPSASRSTPLALREQGGAWAVRTRADLERAGLALKVHEFLAIRIAMALLAFLAAYALGGGGGAALVIGLLVAAVAYMLPAFYVSNRINRQAHKFNDQLPETLTMISNSLRAGFGLLQALDLAAEQSQPPMSTELNRLLRDTRMGASIETALENMDERIGSYDLQVVITAILIQRSVGSNLSEVLDQVAHTIRERVRLKGEIQTLTAQKRLSGWVVGLMPVAFVGLMMLINFDYMDSLFLHPVGRMMLATAVVLELIGMMVIRRIISVDV